MFEKGMLVGLFSETSLHPGTGTTTEVVDLPIQRERHTGFPIIQSSGLKGAMREKAEKTWGKKSYEVNIIFGPESTEHAGSIGITDARLLAFPVRSLSQVYVWVTCPMVLDRLKRDTAIFSNDFISLPDLSVDEGTALTVIDTDLDTKLVLEEHLLTLDKSKSVEVKTWLNAIRKLMPGSDDNGVYKAVRKKMDNHLVIISNDDFTYLVKHATQVTARNVLNENKTSDNLWYEESLPPDCLFYSMIVAMKPRGENGTITNADDMITKFKSAIKDYIQIGGNETIGMGWCAIQYVPESGGLQ